MIANFQLYWLAGSLICGIYASVSMANLKTTSRHKQRTLRRRIYVSAFLTIWFGLLVWLSTTIEPPFANEGLRLAWLIYGLS